MKIKDILQRDPASHPLVNQGQARIADKDNDRVLAELKLNFDSERLVDGNVILVIDEISKDVKKYLIDMRVQSISKDDLLKVAANFDEPEDRQKVLRIVYEEFRREYSSSIK